MKKQKTALNRQFRKLSIQERIDALLEAGYLDEAEHAVWSQERQLLSTAAANRMIENVIGRFALPEGVAINFPVNNTLYQIPLVVEEPSIVAALSFAALLAEKGGGFQASTDEPILIGQVQLVGLNKIDYAQKQIEQQREKILACVNDCMPRMLARGGGARELSSHSIQGEVSGEKMLIVHIHIDTRDAMGANLVNTACETVAPLLETITGGRAVLKILSNLADRALARASVKFSPQLLGSKNWPGEMVRDRIVLANDFALADPYRATTHNKGIMNGIDAVALATGNDWRSIEAAAHAYAARSGQYRALTQWRVDSNGDLVGEIELPIKVGIIGGSLQTNPAVASNQKLLGVCSAVELAGLMAAVGLAQNFAALRALASSGIQQGHMTLHARSVALAANTPEHLFDIVVKRLVEEGDIKVWKAEAIIKELTQHR